MRIKIHISLIFCLITLHCVCFADAGEMRTWRAKSGSQVEASFVKEKYGYVSLQKEDGAIIKIRLISLCVEDQQYVKEQNKTAHPKLSASKTSGKDKPKPALDIPWPIGAVSEEIKTSDKSDWSYYLYLPKSFRSDRKWPVLFTMSPGGGNAKTLGRYISGAEFNNWIMAVSVQSKNNFNQSGEAIQAMVEDVIKRLPIDEKRMYSTGMSGGARMAFWLAEQTNSKPLAGVLACGAGATRAKLPEDTAIYGLCGSNCFNRWDMACTCKILKNNNSCLRFFVGNHTWADSDLISDGMTWLNLCYLQNVRSTDRQLQQEKADVADKVLAEIERNAEKNPERAYEWALFLSKRKELSSEKATEYLQSLSKHPRIKLYIQALNDLDKFVEKHFATDVMDYLNNNGTKAAKSDADALTEKYKETVLAELFQKMGEPARTPGGAKKKKK
ncbi:SHD1 domain-containing protein [Verrucomicrobiota bacterium]